MNNLILSKLFSSLEGLILENKFLAFGMPAFVHFLKKVENIPNIYVIFLVQQQLLPEDKFIITKKIKNFNKEIVFINEYYFFKK